MAIMDQNVHRAYQELLAVTRKLRKAYQQTFADPNTAFPALSRLFATPVSPLRAQLHQTLAVMVPLTRELGKLLQPNQKGSPPSRLERYSQKYAKLEAVVAEQAMREALWGHSTAKRFQDFGDIRIPIVSLSRTTLESSSCSLEDLYNEAVRRCQAQHQERLQQERTAQATLREFMASLTEQQYAMLVKAAAGRNRITITLTK